jgi:MFS family permease
VRPQAKPDWHAAADVVAARRRTLRLLSIAQILGGIGSGAGLSVGILLAEDVTSSEGWAGLARSGTTIGAALFAIPLAAIAIREGRRVSLGGGWLVAGVGSALLVVAAQRGHGTAATILLVAGMVLAGCGTAVTLQSRYAAIDLAPPARRSRDLSLVVWSTTVGSVLGPNLGAPGHALADGFGMHPFAGPFVIATAMQILAAALFMFLRPDPLLLAARMQATTVNRLASAPTSLPGRRRLTEALTTVWGVPPARVALVSICCAHTVMVGVMTMTPVHMEHHGATVTLVGLTISLHVLGMFGLSPVVGVLSDRLGRVQMIAVGSVVLLIATAVAGTAGGSAFRVTTGLVLLGIGWSLSLVAASALLTESVAPQVRTRVQGAADAAMNACAAIGAGISGPLLGLIGFGGLNVLAAAVVAVGAPFVIAGLRRPARIGATS